MATPFKGALWGLWDILGGYIVQGCFGLSAYGIYLPQTNMEPQADKGQSIMVPFQVPCAFGVCRAVGSRAFLHFWFFGFSKCLG